MDRSSLSRDTRVSGPCPRRTTWAGSIPARSTKKFFQMADTATREGQDQIRRAIQRHERQCRFCRAHNFDDCPHVWIHFLRWALYMGVRYGL